MTAADVEVIRVFLAGYTASHRHYNIDIDIRKTTTLLTPIIKPFITLKVLIQNERTQWLMVRTLCSAFYRVL